MAKMLDPETKEKLPKQYYGQTQNFIPFSWALCLMLISTMHLNHR